MKDLTQIKEQLDFTSLFNYVKSIQKVFGFNDEEASTTFWVIDMWEKKKFYADEFKLNKMNLTQIKDEVARPLSRAEAFLIKRLNMTPLQAETLYSGYVLACEEYAIACQEQLRRDCAELCKLPSDKQSILETPLIK